MIKIFQFIIGWIFLLLHTIIAICYYLLTFSEDSMFENTEPSDIVGEKVWNIMLFKSDKS